MCLLSLSPPVPQPRVPSHSQVAFEVPIVSALHILGPPGARSHSLVALRAPLQATRLAPRARRDQRPDAAALAHQGAGRGRHGSWRLAPFRLGGGLPFGGHARDVQGSAAAAARAGPLERPLSCTAAPHSRPAHTRAVCHLLGPVAHGQDQRRGARHCEWVGIVLAGEARVKPSRAGITPRPVVYDPVIFMAEEGCVTP